jgi:hypothetical protein
MKKLWSASILTLVLCFPALGLPGVAEAQSPRDRVAFGNGVHVGPGEVVHDAVSFGGDTVVEGEVLGDAVSFGGSVILRDGASVTGDVTSFGGSVVDGRGSAVPAAASGHHARAQHGARHHEPRGPLDGALHWLKDAARSAVSHVLLFLLGLLMIGVTRERLRAMQTTMIKDGLKTAGAGLLAYIATGVAIVLFAITIVGIPASVVLALALPVATYVGLAAAATVIGAALPIPKLQRNEVLQLAAGVGVLFVASIVPVVGGIATAVAACLGLGALVRTRFGAEAPSDLPGDGGPYRNSPAAA